MRKILLPTLLLTAVTAHAEPSPNVNSVTVYHQPGCQSVDVWASELEAQVGVSATLSQVDSLQQFYDSYDLQADLAICAFTVANDYAIAGLVPVDQVEEIFFEWPSYLGKAIRPDGEVFTF